MEVIVYLVGVTLLGVAYQPVKAALGDGVLFVSAVVGYLLLLRLIGLASGATPSPDVVPAIRILARYS